jgi:hypothetical protein
MNKGMHRSTCTVHLDLNSNWPPGFSVHRTSPYEATHIVTVQIAQKYSESKASLLYQDVTRRWRPVVVIWVQPVHEAASQDIAVTGASRVPKYYGKPNQHLAPGATTSTPTTNLSAAPYLSLQSSMIEFLDLMS